LRRSYRAWYASSVVSSDATGMLKGRRGQPDIFVAER
jgi:hypothetical protein